MMFWKNNDNWKQKNVEGVENLRSESVRNTGRETMTVNLGNFPETEILKILFVLKSLKLRENISLAILCSEFY